MPGETSTMSPEQLEAAEKKLGLNLAEMYYGIRVGHEASGLDQMRQDARMARNLATRTQELCLGKSDSEPSAPSDEDMGVSVGNRITNYYGTPQPQQTSPPPATSEATPPNVAPVVAGAGSLLKTALISAALIALPSVGVAIPWLAGAFDHPEPAAVVVDTDTDTQTSWAPAATD